MQTIKIPVAAWAAVSRFLPGKAEIRPYLHNVRIEVGATTCRLSATDGSIGGIVAFPHEGGTPATFAVPSTAVPKVTVPKRNPGYVVITLLDDGASIIEAPNGAAGSFTPVTGRLDMSPNLRPLLPHTLSGEVAQFNPRNLARVLDACEDLGRGGWNSGWTHNGDKPAVLHTFGGENSTRLVALAMPWSMAPSTKAVPDLGYGWAFSEAE